MRYFFWSRCCRQITIVYLQIYYSNLSRRLFRCQLQYSMVYDRMIIVQVPIIYYSILQYTITADSILFRKTYQYNMDSPQYMRDAYSIISSLVTIVLQQYILQYSIVYYSIYYSNLLYTRVWCHHQQFSHIFQQPRSPVFV